MNGDLCSRSYQMRCGAGKQQGENRSKEEIIYPLLLLINISRETSTSQQQVDEDVHIAAVLITRIYLYILYHFVYVSILYSTIYRYL